MKYASGMVEERAGNSLPDTSVVIMNGYNRKISNGTMAGKKGTFTIVQRLWRLEGASGACLLHCRMCSAHTPWGFSLGYTIEDVCTSCA